MIDRIDNQMIEIIFTRFYVLVLIEKGSHCMVKFGTCVFIVCL